jgi:hypothetical protein
MRVWTSTTADITGQSADMTGQSVDITGQSADILGQPADMTGQSADMPGQSADFKMWEEICQSKRAIGLHWTAFHSTVPGPTAVVRVLPVNILAVTERWPAPATLSPSSKN